MNFQSHVRLRAYRQITSLVTFRITGQGCAPPITAFQRNYAQQPPQRKGFFGGLVDNIKQEFNKDKEMKENLKKFREEAQKLEESEALRKAREKFHNIEAETSKGGQQIKEQLGSLAEKLGKTLEDAQNTELGKKGKEVTDEIARQAKTAAEAIVKQGENLGNTDAVKAIGKGVRAVQEGVDIGVGVYKPPLKLRKRSESSHHVTTGDDRPIEPNQEAMGVELHKDSKWSQGWQNFKDNNPYVNKVFDWKMKYDESDNPAVRVTRALTDKLTDMFGGMFQKTELSEVLTEICKMDPQFDKLEFLQQVETDIIPNVLEAMIRGDLEILKDWCHEGVYNTLATPINTARGLGHRFDSRVLEIDNVDLAMGKIMDQGPVLVITFQAQQVMVLRNSKGQVVEGDPDKIMRFHYVWVLCRDQTELDPKAAWRVLELAANSSDQWL